MIRALPLGGTSFSKMSKLTGRGRNKLLVDRGFSCIYGKFKGAKMHAMHVTCKNIRIKYSIRSIPFISSVCKILKMRENLAANPNF